MSSPESSKATVSSPESSVTVSSPESSVTVSSPESSAINCQNICEKLITTYNASLIDNLPAELRDACIKEAKECANAPKWRGTEKRNVLAKLIDNYVQQTQIYTQYPRYIEGPLNISCHWHKDFQKLIYIFGEYHGNQKDCDKFKPDDLDDSSDLSMSIEDYLKHYFVKPIAFTDFLIEMKSNVDGYKKLHSETSRLERIRKFFQNCVDSTKRRQEERCNLSRMHYFDIRQGDVKTDQDMFHGTIISSLTKTSQFSLDAYKIAKDLDFVPQTETEIKDAIKNLKTFYKINFDILTVLNECYSDKNKYFNFFVTEFKQYKFLTKEIDRSKSVSDLRIEEFIKEQLRDLIIKSDDVDLENLEKISNAFNNTYHNILKIDANLFVLNTNGEIYDEFHKIQVFLNEMYNLVAIYNGRLADSYLLARIFKKFDIDTENPNKKRPTDEPREPHNIIIYAGNNHSQLYRKFLNRLGFEDKGTGGTGIMDDTDIPKDGLGRRYCVDMKNIVQPLFSGWPPKENGLLGSLFDTQEDQDQG
jgi:hypothetical protein